MSIFSRLCAEVRVHIAYLFNIHFKVEISIKLRHQFDSNKDTNDKDQNSHYRTSIRKSVLISKAFKNDEYEKLISLLNFTLKMKSEIQFNKADEAAN